jgi:hypothetical protein
LATAHVLALAGLASSIVSAAAPGDAKTGASYQLNVGASHSDNVGRTANLAESETSMEVGLGANVQHVRERVRLGLDANLLYRMHNYGSYKNELAGGLAALASYELFHEAVHWVVEDNLGQSLIAAQNIATADNIQNLNVLSTGPDVSLPIGPRTGIVMHARWTDVWYESSDFGSRRYSASVGLRRQIGEHSNISLTGSTEHLDYKELPTSSNYSIRSASFGWEAVGARTELNVRAGLSRLDDQQETSNGALFALELSRKLYARGSLALHVGRNFGNSSDALGRDQGIRGTSTGSRPGTASSDPLRSDYATLIWSHDAARSSLSLTADWRREAHEREQNLNRTLRGAGMQISRQLSPRTQLKFFADYTGERFNTAAVDFDDWSAGVGMSWRFSSALGLSLDWAHQVGNGDTLFGPNTRDYTENRYTARFTWSPSN